MHLQTRTIPLYIFQWKCIFLHFPPLSSIALFFFSLFK
uniref:Uncharacterized protein n=1 Tax=Anguilla anguilla TaxID=7936 RepID=A0A0E9PZV6_ANGAN